MIEITAAQEERFIAWAERVLDLTWDRRFVRWLSGVDGGEIVWVAVYSHFTSRSCDVSLATDRTKRWASRRAIRWILRAPFAQWGMRRVSFTVQERNAESRELCERIGAKHEGTLRAAFAGDVDGILYGLLAEEARRWID